MNRTDRKQIVRVVTISILLVFFALPHTLEDFAVGEPEKAGVPAPMLSLVISVIFAIQALGLYWLGSGKRRGLWAHAIVGFFWPVAAGVAQVPALLNGEPYRDGLISVLYVVGIIAVGAALAVTSVQALRTSSSSR